MEGDFHCIRDHLEMHHMCYYCISQSGITVGITKVLEQIMGECCIKIEPAANVIGATCSYFQSLCGHFSAESSSCYAADE